MRLSCRILLMLSVTLLPGCGDGGTASVQPLEARYDLQLISDRPPPFRTDFAPLSKAEMHVLGGAIVPLSRGMLLDIVTYQLTDMYGNKQEPYDDTTSVAYSLSGTRLTLQRVRSDGTTTPEVWTLGNGSLRGSRTYDNFVELQVGPFASQYMAPPNN